MDRIAEALVRVTRVVSATSTLAIVKSCIFAVCGGFVVVCMLMMCVGGRS